MYWEVAAGFGGLGSIAGSAAIVGNLDLCCEQVGGYANDWYQAIRIEYSGSGTIQFDYALDSETGFDFLTIEADSNCASFDRVELEDDHADVAGSWIRSFDTKPGR